MKKDKIVIIGNCQARPLKNIIEVISNQVEVIGTPIVHLLKDEDQEETEALLNSADIIITQMIADNYPCKYIQTSRLKSLHGKKLITILNLFYTGYTPEWLYVRIPGKGTLRGPMGDYHNLTIIESWLSGISIEKTVELLFDVEFNQSKYCSAVETSLNELRKRESYVDVAIVDFILANLENERLFFTFNHPSIYLLKEYARRILEKLSLSYSLSKLSKDIVEPLNQFIPALNPGVGLNVEICREYKGVIVEVNGKTITTKSPCIYSPEKLVQVYFNIYNNHKELIRDKYAA